MRNAISLVSPSSTPPGQDARRAAVLTKATVRAALALGLSQAELAAIIGVSPASVTRMKDGGFVLSGKQTELAACVVRVFRSLDAIAGGDRATLTGWMRSPNGDLGGIPRERMRDVTGLVEVMAYLDAQRAPL